jgi:hypothetical protein
MTIIGEHIYKIVTIPEISGRCVNCATRNHCGTIRLNCVCNFNQHYAIDIKEERKFKLKRLNEKIHENIRER